MSATKLSKLALAVLTASILTACGDDKDPAQAAPTVSAQEQKVVQENCDIAPEGWWGIEKDGKVFPFATFIRNGEGQVKYKELGKYNEFIVHGVDSDLTLEENHDKNVKITGSFTCDKNSVYVTIVDKESYAPFIETVRKYTWTFKSESNNDRGVLTTETLVDGKETDKKEFKNVVPVVFNHKGK